MSVRYLVLELNYSPTASIVYEGLAGCDIQSRTVGLSGIDSLQYTNNTNNLTN